MDTLRTWERRYVDSMVVRVYPRVVPLRSLPRPFHTQPSVGDYVSSALGEGIEPGDIRQFAPGDRIRHVNWRASLRLGRLHVTQRHLERNADVVLMLDTLAEVDPEMAKKQGGKQVIGAVGGLHIPPVDIWIAGYQYCAKLFNPQIKVLTGYSGDFVKSDLCKTVAENQIAQGAQVLFQVAGGCGLGTLTAASQAGIWGIGVDKDQYNDAKRVLTSGVKRVDLGVLNVIKATKNGKFKGNTDLQFTLANGGMSVGRINPAVPQALIDKMNALKQRIISGEVTVPTTL